MVQSLTFLNIPSRSCASSGTNWPLVYIDIFSYTVCRLKLGEIRFDTHRPQVRPFSKNSDTEKQTLTAAALESVQVSGGELVPRQGPRGHIAQAFGRPRRLCSLGEVLVFAGIWVDVKDKTVTLGTATSGLAKAKTNYSILGLAY